MQFLNCFTKFGLIGILYDYFSFCDYVILAVTPPKFSFNLFKFSHTRGDVEYKTSLSIKNFRTLYTTLTIKTINNYCLGSFDKLTRVAFLLKT